MFIFQGKAEDWTDICRAWGNSESDNSSLRKNHSLGRMKLSNRQMSQAEAKALESSQSSKQTQAAAF